MTAEDLQPYQRITQDVKDQVRLGRLKSNDKLPSTRELSDHYGVAPGTVQRALAELRKEGVVYSHQGRGSYVRESAVDAVADPTARAIQQLQKQVADLTERLERLEADNDEKS
ncbi:GntR family transcriptional regulator [Streptomyces sp. NPDC052127]|uniref:GntR family transcriptional regulator n=1 Tax=unclassified Streptomyces TaxID=2593676 RepID=UPI0032562F85